MSKNSLIKGTIILTAANLITRVLGFFYRIYMSNTIGAEGIGLYQLIMPIYMLCWSITSSGLTTTISKLTAQENAKKQYGNMGRILKQSLAICLTLSLILSFVLFFMSDYIAVNILNEERTAISLKILACCFPFMSAGSCIRGYFYGVQNNVIPALSQILEQTIRILTVFTLSALFSPRGLEYACAAAVIGIVLGEVISFVFVLASYILFKKKKPYFTKPAMSTAKTFLLIISMAIPLSANRVTGSLLSTIEEILIPQRLILYGNTGSDAMSLFGMLTGMAMPLIQFPSALLMAVSINLVPAISEASAINNQRRIKYTAYNSLLYTFIIGIGACCVFMVFSNEISLGIYNQANLGPLLFKLAFMCPVLYMNTTISGLLNGLGEQVFIFRNSLLSSAVSICFIYFLIPLYGIDAFIAGWLLSLIITVSLSIRKIIKTSDITLNFKKLILKPSAAAVISGIFVKILFACTDGTFTAVLLCILLMMLIYVLILNLFKVISIKEIFLMFFGNKVNKHTYKP